MTNFLTIVTHSVTLLTLDFKSNTDRLKQTFLLMLSLEQCQTSTSALNYKFDNCSFCVKHPTYSESITTQTQESRQSKSTLTGCLSQTYRSQGGSEWSQSFTCSSQNICSARWVGEHAAQGYRKQTSGETPGGTLGKSWDRGGEWVEGWSPAVLLGL